MFLHPDRHNLALIEYSGDEKAARHFPQGLARVDNSRNYIRTQPPVLKDMRMENGRPQKVYQRLVSKAAASRNEHCINATPRNTAQVRNMQKFLHNKERPSRDAIFNLHEFAYDSDFVHRITTYPDLIVIMYHPEIMATFRYNYN